MTNNQPQSDATPPASSPVETKDSNAPTFDGEYDPERAARAIENLRNENKKLKERAGALPDDAAKKLADYDRLVQASKTELERAQEAATTYQRQAEAAQRAALVNEVALEKGLSAQLAKRLQGDTRDELAADADELLSQFSTTDTEPRRPRPDLSQGRTSGANTDEGAQFGALITNQLAR